MINLCPNIWFIKNSKCQQFFHLKKEPPKKHKFFIFLKGCYFVMGSPIDMNVDVFWETSVGFLKSVVLQLFPKYSPSNINLNVKSRAKLNCFQKVDGLFSCFLFECNLKNSIIKAFLNDLGQIRDVCSFEDIGQSRFHEKSFKCK